MALLLEILTEELPALPLLKALDDISKTWQNITKSHNITSSPELFYTPRRIVLYDTAFPTKTESRLIECYGAPLSIAYIDGDKAKGLSSAGLSFYKKYGLDSNIALESRIKDGKEVLYYAYMQEGIESAELLPSIIEQWLSSLHFGKSMLWGDIDTPFIRPVRNILAFLDDKHISFKAFGLDSMPQTFIHRDISFAPIKVKSISDYFQILESGKVVLEQDKREAIILSHIAEIEKSKRIKVQMDRDLLAEIVAITEYPMALYGSFEQKFLELPKEVIITSMKENQRYFATYNAESSADSADANLESSNLNNGFIVVANTTTDNLAQVVQGNEKVLKARLSDAVFFYHNDLKSAFNSDKLAQLSNIVFVDKLGSLMDKSKREQSIAFTLFDSYSKHIDTPNAKEILQTAITYAKADLLSEMVYEFTELQGIMGYYYAKASGFNDLSALAIKEQYLPLGEDSALPTNIISAILALSIKLDNIFALFSINMLPSGSKDPYALRRAASGIIKIIAHFKLDFDFKSDIARLYKVGGYKDSDMERIELFFIERLQGVLGVNASLIRCCLNAKVNGKRLSNLSVIIENIKALNEFFEKSDKSALASLFKRVANILGDKVESSAIDSTLLEAPAEKALFEAINALESSTFNNASEAISALFSLNVPMAAFFDSVLVNVESSALKANRQALILRVYNAFLRIGDIKEIAI